ncbi:hypothetical protein [Ottowia sp.]|jgi:hypothetical protein|uniref:hypothetical protein n=1 Tax=Ottowia sp. TaxID=1898956 RepID=UPI0026000D04|nr:hypothetical protein [Ottowia sp.]MBK6615738.1 hypothetical protein [Ottowia sp.]
MSKNLLARQSTEAPQKTAAAGGRVFKFSYKNIPVVSAKMWAQMEAAARTPDKGRSYPVMIEAPDAEPAGT